MKPFYSAKRHKYLHDCDDSSIESEVEGKIEESEPGLAVEPEVEGEPQMEPKVDELAVELEANLQDIDQQNSPYITRTRSRRVQIQ